MKTFIRIYLKVSNVFYAFFISAFLMFLILLLPALALRCDEIIFGSYGIRVICLDRIVPVWVLAIILLVWGAAFYFAYVFTSAKESDFEDQDLFI